MIPQYLGGNLNNFHFADGSSASAKNWSTINRLGLKAFAESFERCKWLQTVALHLLTKDMIVLVGFEDAESGALL